MIKSKAYEIFKDSLKKLNSMIFNLDKNLGMVSSNNANVHLPNLENKLSLATCSPNNNSQINTEVSEEKTQVAKEIKKTQNTNSKPSQPKVQNKNENSPLEIFNDVDIRVGRVTELRNKEGSEDIYLLKVDVGEPNLRNIGTGLRKFVPASELEGKNVLVFANLKPKKLGDFMSEGMILCSYNDDETKFELPRPAESESVFVEGSGAKQSFLSALNDKKFKKAIAFFKTDGECNATFNGMTLQTSTGNVKVNTLKDCRIS